MQKTVNLWKNSISQHNIQANCTYETACFHLFAALNCFLFNFLFLKEKNLGKKMIVVS